MGNFRCVIHGSFSKHLDKIQDAIKVFNAADIEVIAPISTEIVDNNDGFVLFEGEVGQDPRLVELLYIHIYRN